MRRSILIAAVVALALLPTAPAADRHLRALGVLLRVAHPEDTSWAASYRRHHVVVTETPLTRGIPARTYTPAGATDPPVMLLIHGVHSHGFDEPRLVRFARSLAEGGIRVVTPHLARLADYRITPESVRDIGTAAEAVHRSAGRRAGLFGLSFSGGLSLLAAADPRYAEHIAFVVAIGAHSDMERVARYYATSEASYPDGTPFREPAHEYGALVLIYSDLPSFFAPRDIAAAHETLKTLLYTEDLEAARPPAQALSPAGRERMEKLFARQREEFVPDLLRSLTRRREEMRQVSPHGHLGGLRVPVLLVHGAGDTVIPPTETAWLAREVPAGWLRQSLVTPVLSHVSVDGAPGWRDRALLVHAMAGMLAEAGQERR
jgi:pimeloyl-ACP methyl ester carboxylesterase